MANILVTGGAGYVGSHVLRPLIEQGHRPIVLDDLSRGHRELATRHPQVQLVEGSLEDRHLLAQLLREHRIDAVMHYAALAYVEESLHRPGEYYQVNTAGTLTLVQEMVAYRPEQPPPLVFSSSCAVYGLTDHAPIPEQTRQQPITPYGRSKLAAEWLINDMAAAHGFAAVILRYFNAAGAEPEHGLGEWHEPETHLIPLALRAAESGQPFLIRGTDFDTPDGTAVRDFVHVSDLAAAHLAALHYLLAGGDSADFNLGSGCGHSVRQVLSSVERATHRPITAQAAPRRPGDPGLLICDSRKANAVLGWTPMRQSLDRIVADAAAWEAQRCG